MSGTDIELGLRSVLAKTLHPRVVVSLRLVLTVSAIVAVLLQSPTVAVILLLLTILLLVFPGDAKATYPPPSSPSYTVPLIENVTRQLATSLSISQVATVVLSTALRATHAEVALLALPPEVDHFMTIQLRRGEDTIQIIQRPFTAETLLEQALQQGHQRRALISRDGSAIAVMLRHEYLVIGALSVENETQALGETDSALLSEIAVPAAISLHNARLLEEQQAQIETLSHIQALTLRLAGAAEGDAVIRAILETTRDILGVQEVALYRSKDDAPESIMSLHRDRFNSSRNAKRLTQATALRMFQSGEVQITRQPVTCVAVPVEKSGATRIVLAVAFIERHTLRQRDLDTLDLLAEQTAAHLDTVELHERVSAVSDRLRDTLNSSQDAVMVIDPAGRLVECNPAAERFLGVDKANFLGKPYVGMLFEILKAGEQSALGYSRSQLPEVAQQLRSEPSRILRRRFEQRGGGQERTLEEISAPVIDGHGQIRGRLITLRDVTEQKQLADFRAEMMHMAVHDLRGPLTAIMNGIDMTLNLGLSDYPEENERVLRLSLASAADLMRLINGLLDIARLENQRMPIKQQPVAAGELIESAWQALESSIAEAEITVELMTAEDLPLLNVDRDLIRRVLVNLIDNAVRYTPSGKKILISAGYDSNQQVTISVEDSGPGIPVADRERVFEQYRQSTHKPLRGSNGTGLGLSFCKLAVEAHGGRIWAEASSVLPGARICIQLPLAV
jgi:PAS domain S-box-containing protein